MTCRDCIYHKTCCYVNRFRKDSDGEKKIITETNNVEDTCEDFSDRASWVKLPCKVGDTLYEPTDRGAISEYEVLGVCVELFSTFVEYKIKDENIWKYVHEISSDEIGKTVFLSREEAERALEERESNER